MLISILCVLAVNVVIAHQEYDECITMPENQPVNFTNLNIYLSYTQVLQANICTNFFPETLTIKYNQISQLLPLEIRISDLMERVVYTGLNFDFAFIPFQRIELCSIIKPNLL